MQDNYSLKLALLDEARGGFEDGDASLGRLSQPERLAGRSTPDAVQAPLSGLSLALANAGLQINGLILEQGLLRESLVSLNNTLSSQLALLEPKDGSAVAGSTGEPGSKNEASPVVKLEMIVAGLNLLLNLVSQQRDLKTATTQNVTGVINPGAVGLTSDGTEHGQSHDQASWTESSGTSLTLNARLMDIASTLQRHADIAASKVSTPGQAAVSSPDASKPAAPENSVQANREAYEASKERLVHTLDTSPSPLENTQFKALSWMADGANSFAEDSPRIAGTLKSVGATLGPMVGSALGAVVDEAKTRIAGKAVDAVSGGLFKASAKIKGSQKSKARLAVATGIGGLGNLLKGKDEGKKGDCCCPGEAKLAGITSYVSEPAPESTKPSKNAKSGKGVRGAKATKAGKTQGTVTQPASDPRQAKNLVVGNAATKSLATVSNEKISRRGRPSQRMGFAPPMAPVQNLTAISRATKTSTSRLTGAMAKLGSAGIRRSSPMRLATAAFDVVQGAQNGDLRAVGAGLGTAGGAWAGASAGAALGTLILPGIGTAVGGALGGFFGSDAGAWLGDKLGGMVDRLRSPDEVSKQLTNNAPADNRQITLSPVINISGLDPNSAQQVATMVIQTLQNQCMPMMTDALAVRRSATLTDGVA
ncbi:hypothetical protein [Pseudomonas spelaei]|nr:hypothetical protein [Pseudomonas spelaei]